MLFYLSRGLDYTQILILSVVIGVTQISFEVPSGVFADFFGRKKTLAVATFFRFICFSIYFVFDSFWLFAVGCIFIGMSFAFESGSDAAFIYDTLRDLKKESIYKKIEGRAWSYNQVAMALGALSATLFITYSFKIPILITALMALTASFVALSFKEPQHHKKSAEKKYFQHLKIAMRFSVNHPLVKWLIIYSGLMFSLMIMGHKFVQPYLQEAGVDLAYFGIFYFVLLLVSAAIAYYAHQIEEKIGMFNSLLLIPLFMAFQFLITGTWIFAGAIIVFLIGNIAWGFFRPVILDYVNKHVESYHRATVLSLNGFFKSIMMISLAPLVGYIADLYSFTTVFLLEGIIVLVLGVPLAFIISRVNNKTLPTQYL